MFSLPRGLGTSRVDCGNTATETNAAMLKLGAHAGQYSIIEKLGEGGMGEVYRAEDKRLVSVRKRRHGLNRSRYSPVYFLAGISALLPRLSNRFAREHFIFRITFGLPAFRQSNSQPESN